MNEPTRKRRQDPARPLMTRAPEARDTTKAVTVRFPTSLLTKLQKLADADDRSLSSYLTRHFRIWLAAQKSLD
jgi:hypothetical protein